MVPVPQPRIVHVTFYTDPARRLPGEQIRGWRDFGQAAAAVARTGVPVSVIQSSWVEGDHRVGDVRCRFVRPERVLGELEGQGPTLIHVHGLLLPARVRALTRRVPRVPVLVQDHGSGVPRRWWRRRWHRWGFARITGVMFTARAQAVEFVEAGVLRRDLAVFEAIEGSTPFRPGDQAAARAATGLSGDPCLLWVGNLDENKDPLVVLDAVSRAASHFPELALWMCYRFAPLHERVRERITRDPALANRVHLKGEVAYPGIERFFQAADFVVQASHKEGSGYGIIEALACGTTPLVTDIPSFRAITGNGAFGALVRPGDADGMAAAIRDWAGRDRAALRRGAREHFERELSFDAIGRQLVAAYRELTSS